MLEGLEIRRESSLLLLSPWDTENGLFIFSTTFVNGMSSKAGRSTQQNAGVDKSKSGRHTCWVAPGWVKQTMGQERRNPVVSRKAKELMMSREANERKGLFELPGPDLLVLS